MPALCFVGDVHGQLVNMYTAIQAWMDRTGTKIDGIVQVGDLGVFLTGSDWSTMWQNGTPAPIPTWVVMGNHESPRAIAAWQNKPNQIPGMYLLPDGEISDVLGVRVGVVWGNFSPISWLNPGRVVHNRAIGDSQRIAMHIDKNAVDSLLANHSQMDVLVTHESANETLPVQFRGRGMDSLIKGLLGLEENEVVAGCPAFDVLLKVFKPHEYYFGHVHAFDEGMIGITHYTCLNAIGYPNGPWFKVQEFEDYKLVSEDDGGINILGGGN